MMVQMQMLDGARVASLAGKHLDAGNVQQFRQEMEPLCEAGALVLCDLGQVEFIDSSGVGALLVLHRKARAQGGSIRFCGLNKRVRQVLELVRMQQVFEIYDTLESALGAC